MKSLVIIVTVFFSFSLFDINLFRRQRFGAKARPLVETELSDQKEKVRKTQRKYKNQKHKRRKLFPIKRYKYSEARPRDNRFSNQQSLRRMYRNG